MRLRFQRLAIGAAGLAAALGATPATASSTAGSPAHWRVFDQVKSDGQNYITSVSAASRSDAWAVGVPESGFSGGYILHWNGRSWAKVASPEQGFAAQTVTAVSARDVWLFGYGTALNLAGGTWTSVSTPSLLGPLAVVASQLWVSGLGPGDSTARTSLAVLAAGGWVHSQLPFTVEGISGTARDDVWAVGFTLRGHRPKLAAARWNGTAWRTVKVSVPAKYDYSADPLVDVASSRSVWISASGLALLHWNGRGWTTRPISARAKSGAGVPLLVTRQGIWVSPSALWTGRKWVYVRTDLPASCAGGWINDMTAVPGSQSLWGAMECQRAPSRSPETGGIGLYGPVP
jgi:hypothetical protein